MRQWLNKAETRLSCDPERLEPTPPLTSKGHRCSAFLAEDWNAPLLIASGLRLFVFDTNPSKIGETANRLP
jgi:hypothetical protein